MKKYPKWFSVYSKPIKPTPPCSTITSYDTVKVIRLDTWSTEPFESVDADSISVEIEYDTYDNNVIAVNVLLKKQKISKNPNYNKLNKEYTVKLEEYNVKIKEWNDIKKQYDADMEEVNKTERKKQYEKLKEEFE